MAHLSADKIGGIARCVPLAGAEFDEPGVEVARATAAQLDEPWFLAVPDELNMQETINQMQRLG